MEEYADDYKKLTQNADFILLVINKIITIVNGRFAWHASDLNTFINEKNIMGLKKSHSSWPELVKTYANFLTSVTNMVSMNAIMNFSRKQIIASLDIEKNTEKIESATQKFIDTVETILVCLDFFSNNIDIVQPKSKEVGDMKSVHKIITDALDKLKKTHLPKIKQVKLDAKLKTLGAAEDGYQVIVGGEKEKIIRIGGFNVEKTVKHDIIQLDLFEKDLTTLAKADIVDIDNYINKFIGELAFFSELAGKSEKEIAEFLVIRSMASKNLADQFLHILTRKIPELIKYHQNRFGQENESSLILGLEPGHINAQLKYKDVYGEINTNIDWQTLTPKKSVHELVDLITKIFVLIDKADKHKITKDAKKCFTELNEIKNNKVLLQKLDELNDNHRIITDDFTFEARRNAKNTIKRIIEKILNDKDTEIKFSETKDETHLKIDDLLANKDKSEKLALLKKLISNAKKTINIETKIMPKLKDEEIKYDNLTNVLNDLMIEITTLISPDNKYTCIKRPSLVLSTGISAVIMQNLIEKRFTNDEKKDKILEKSKILPVIINVCDSMLETNTKELYSSDDGLNMTKIENVVNTLV